MDTSCRSSCVSVIAVQYALVQVQCIRYKAVWKLQLQIFPHIPPPRSTKLKAISVRLLMGSLVSSEKLKSI